MPDIRKMGEYYALTVEGKLIKFLSYDDAYEAWEEAQKRVS